MPKQLCFLVVSLIAFFGVPVLSVPPNPCPDIFSYVTEPYGGRIVGMIDVPNLHNGFIDLHVNASMAGYYGKENSKMVIKMLTRPEELVLQNPPNAQFQVDFPVQEAIPRITEVLLNGRVYCSGPPEQLMVPGPPITSMYVNFNIKFSAMRDASASSEVKPVITIHSE